VNPVDAVRAAAVPLEGGSDDYDRLLDLIGDAGLVLLGEASHGTREFYRERARITRRLLDEKGFSLVAVEADWPDAYRVNRWVRGESADATALGALEDFRRFPRWMWRNREVLDFVEWLRARNAGLPRDRQAGFYGLDLYSLFTSMEAVVGFLDEVDPLAAARARRRYACFDHFGEDTQAYGYAAELGLARSCEDAAVAQLVELQREMGRLARRDGRIPEDELFFTEQNARLVRNAEQYYRIMFRGRVESWNLRDRHMVETLLALRDHFGSRGEPARAVVWAHNSHLGDARATAMGDQGELNVGQLVREYAGADAILVGFTTHTGTVTAAVDWEAPAELMRVRPSFVGSVERLFHEAEIPRFILPLRGALEAGKALDGSMLERAIGVIYRPETERLSHYFTVRLPEQFDAVIHLDRTTAIEPLDASLRWSRTSEAPETYPTGV
jgi:erythromycin esterase-like protein